MATLQTGTPQHATPQRFDPHTGEQFRFDPIVSTLVVIFYSATRYW